MARAFGRIGQQLLVEPFDLIKIEAHRPVREEQPQEIREEFANQRFESLIVVHTSCTGTSRQSLGFEKVFSGSFSESFTSFSSPSRNFLPSFLTRIFVGCFTPLKVL